MKDNLLLITNIKKTIIYINKIIDNFPNKENTLKTRIINTMYNILENTYMANIDKIERNKYLRLIIKDIKMIDFYLKISFEKKNISLKKYNSVGNYLLEINTNIIKWMNYEKSK